MHFGQVIREVFYNVGTRRAAFVEGKGKLLQRGTPRPYIFGVKCYGDIGADVIGKDTSCDDRSRRRWAW